LGVSLVGNSLGVIPRQNLSSGESPVAYPCVFSSINLHHCVPSMCNTTLLPPISLQRRPAAMTISARRLGRQIDGAAGVLVAMHERKLTLTYATL
jgi:hypothetical protein